MEYWFDADAAGAAEDFFPRHCRFSKGEWAGRRFHLAPWQRDAIIRPLFGWKRRDHDDPAHCTRRYRRAVVFVPRKNGKTELAAGVGLLGLVGDGEPGADVYSIAANESQARIVFDQAYTMCALSPSLAQTVETFQTSIYCPALNGRFMPLSGKAFGKHGLNPHVMLGDEAHEWRTADLYQWVRQGMGSRRQPLEFIISTAGEATGFGWELYNEAVQIRDGVIDDPETLVVIYAAAADADIEDPSVWAMANPNLGVSLKVDYMEREARKARSLARYENDFKRYHLNIWTEQATRWLPMDDWTGLAPEPENKGRWKSFDDRFTGRPCWGGLDIAATRDLTALVWVFPPAGGDPNYAVICRFWLPEAQAQILRATSRVPFDLWARDGALTITDGNVADHAAILAQVLEDNRRFNVRGLGADKWNALTLTQQMQSQGVPVAWIAQNLATLSTPSKSLERLVLAGQLDHGHHPVLRWMAANTAVKPDRNDNYRPLKDKSAGKIDGIAALVTALAMEAHQPVDTPSYLASSELLVLA